MQFKDYYATLGVARDASQDDIKQAYRRLARKYHPDVSKETDAEARFKEISEASEVLRDPEKRAAYDQAGRQWEGQRATGSQDFQPPPGWDAGFEFSGRGDEGGFGSAEDLFGQGGFGDHSDFFEALFGRARSAGSARASRSARPDAHVRGQDHHAKVMVGLEDAYHGAQRSIVLRLPALDEHGRTVMHERTLDINIPKGIREGQHLRLAGQGGPGIGNAPAGDLFLEIMFEPHPHYRVDGRDVYVDLPLAPWEAALGATVEAPTPAGAVQLTIPAGSQAGRKLRLKGRGIPANGPNGTPGDLYAVLTIVLPKADTPKAKAAYQALADAVVFDPRKNLQE